MGGHGAPSAGDFGHSLGGQLETGSAVPTRCEKATGGENNANNVEGTLHPGPWLWNTEAP